MLKRQYGDWHLRRTAMLGLCTVAIFSFVALIHSTYYPFASPIFAVSIVLLAARPGLRQAPGMFFGGISYPMYLNHWMGVFIAHGVAKRVDFLPRLPKASLHILVECSQERWHI